MQTGQNRTWESRHLPAHIGPGGLRCSCCTDFPPALQKKHDRRKARRLAKVNLKQEMEYED